MQIVNYTMCVFVCVCACLLACVRACVRKLANKRESERFSRLPYRPYWIRKSAIILVFNSQIVLNE